MLGLPEVHSLNSPASPAAFDRLGLAPAVLQSVLELGYEVPTPVQAQCIPHLLAGHDLVGQAQTGTGKTAAFALPLLSRIEVGSSLPQVLVLAPTRELALQVAEAFQRYAHHLRGFHVLPLYGGQAYGLQIRQLRRGAQVIVGTPGRVMDHLRRGTLSLEGIRTLVLDEADEMLNMGFADDIEWIFGQAPVERQVALFSATLPQAIRQVARRHLREPVEIQVASRSATVDTIDQQHCVVTRHQKLQALTRLLEVESFDAMLVFVRTKHATLELAEKLAAHGFAAEALNGDMTQALRERAVERLKGGKLDILVATDVAARGLDVERISHVVNFDIPNDPASYVHRIGRTGRAGREGRAWLFVEPRERYLLRAIEGAIGQRIPFLEPPSADQLSAHRIDRFTALVRQTLAEQELDFFYPLVARIAQEQELDMLDIAAALTFLAQRERPLAVAPDRPAADAGRERSAHRERPQRPRRGAGGGEPPAMVSYRIEVGRRDGVSPREIVGAIANEAGLEGRYIGRIDIRDDHCLVDLPEGMPKAIQRHLAKVVVCGQALNLTVVGRPRPDTGGTGRGRRGKRRAD
jgi:ATP-dependent RNA helicase DeaD